MKHIKTAGIIIASALIILSMCVQPATANPGTRWDSLWGFLKDNYDDVEGGYHLVGKEASNIMASYPAALILEDMGLLDDRPPVIDLVKIKNFTNKVQWLAVSQSEERYGGLGPFIAGTPTMESTYYAIRLRELIDPQTDIPNINLVKEINSTAMLQWVNRSQSVHGGFSNEQGKAPDLLSTYRALYLITNYASKTNWTVDDLLLNKTKTLEWIMDCQDGNAFKLSPGSALPSITATTAALLSLDLLDHLSDLGNAVQNIRDWILDRQTNSSVTADYYGGFEEGVLTNDTNVVSTYYAVVALDLLGTTPRNISAVADFLLQCQTSDGGFAIVPNGDVGNMLYSGMVIHILKLLGDEYTSLLYGPDPLNPSPPLIDWRVLFVISLIMLAAIVAIVSLRRD